jgi:hypothetical protein
VEIPHPKNHKTHSLTFNNFQNATHNSFACIIPYRHTWTAFIAQYLIKHGIDAARIAWKGFGDESPIDSNETQEGRARNRRVEFEVMDY